MESDLKPAHTLSHTLSTYSLLALENTFRLNLVFGQPNLGPNSIRQGCSTLEPFRTLCHVFLQYCQYLLGTHHLIKIDGLNVQVRQFIPVSNGSNTEFKFCVTEMLTYQKFRPVLSVGQVTVAAKANIIFG